MSLQLWQLAAAGTTLRGHGVWAGAQRDGQGLLGGKPCRLPALSVERAQPLCQRAAGPSRVEGRTGGSRGPGAHCFSIQFS